MMKASKENAAWAIGALDRILRGEGTPTDKSNLPGFLEAVKKRLPSEEAYKRNEMRRNRKKEVEAAARRGFYGQ